MQGSLNECRNAIAVGNGGPPAGLWSALHHIFYICIWSLWDTSLNPVELRPNLKPWPLWGTKLTQPKRGLEEAQQFGSR